MKWFINLPQWARLTIGLTAAAAMFVLIWRLVVEKQKHEADWHPQARAWNHIPLTVDWDEHFWGAHNKSISDAIDEVNRAVGCKVLSAAPAEGPADIQVLSATGEPCGDMEGLVIGEKHAAQTYLCPNMTAEIHILEPGDITQSFVIVSHELGHALGLADDGYYPIPESKSAAAMSVSLMAINAAEHSYRLGQGLRLPALSDKDRAALKKRYCGKP